VAQYGDACNLFGGPDDVRHKLDVLERHCAEIGRDPGEITKTRLGTLVIAPTQEEAEAKVRALIERRGGDGQFLSRALVGGPVRIAEETAALLDAGLDGLIFNLPDADDRDTITLAGHVLCDALGITAAA
jgi:alkanesulfonate monooxygenase SsuD/methylene tetrahydromethanopterin reductase-like flavin-dependent oxidoreductase (luciferase family)